ncbi:MAG TPA: zf-HC2 domain-containing protein [bacterium]|nr:zf-HC2 domain-containing protein [bacterium]
MNCTECQDLMNSYVGDELEEKLRNEVESHLVNCADCSCEVADWQTFLNWLRVTFPDQRLPVAFLEKM